MKNTYLFLLFVFILESCSIQSSGQNGTAGKSGASAKGVEKGKNGTVGENGQNKSATIGLDINKKNKKE